MPRTKWPPESTILALLGFASSAVGGALGTPWTTSIAPLSTPPLTFSMFSSWLSVFMGGLLVGAPANWKVLVRLYRDRRELWGPFWGVVNAGILPGAVVYYAVITTMSSGLNPIVVWCTGFALGVLSITLYGGTGMPFEG